MRLILHTQHFARHRLDIIKGLTTEFILFSVSTIVFQLSRLVVSLIVAKWVGPERFGVWNALQLLLLYGALVTLGVPNGMNRDVPLLNGAGDKIASERIVNISFSFVLFSSIITAFTIAIVAIGGRMHQKYWHPLFWMGFLFVAWQIYQYFQFLLKCHIRFRLMSIQQLTFAFSLPVVVLPLVRLWDISGFIFGQGMVAVGVSLLICRLISFRITLSWDRETFFSLVQTGFPIMAAGLLYSLLTSIDRWVILKFLGVEALGHYTLAILCLGILGLLPAVIAQQMYPRMAFRYGRTLNKRSLIPMVIGQSLAGAVITLPLLMAVYILLPFVTTHFLPAYSYGIVPARYLLIGLAFIPLGGGVANYLNTIGKQMYYLITQFGAVLVNLSLDILFVKIGWGLTGVALGAATSYALYTLTLILVGIWIAKNEA